MSEISAFLGQQSESDAASFWVIPAPIDDGADMIKGQAAAPASILAASAWVESYDEEIASVPGDTAPVHTAEPADNIATLQQSAKAALDTLCVPVIIGGDPSVSIAGIRALSEKADDFTILHISARTGLKDKPGSSSGVIREALSCQNLKKVLQVGVRNLSAAESEVLFGDDDRVETYFACDLAKTVDDEDWHEDLIQDLSTPVYLSIDLSGLDRSIVNSVGFPEPGGVLWWDLLRLLKKVTSRRRIAAFDIVDLVPIEGDMNGDYAAAKLIQKIMSYMVVSGKMLDPAVDGDDAEEGEETEE